MTYGGNGYGESGYGDDPDSIVTGGGGGTDLPDTGVGGYAAGGYGRAPYARGGGASGPPPDNTAIFDGHVPPLTGGIITETFVSVPPLTGGMLLRRHNGVWDRTTMLGADGVHPNDDGMTFLAKVMVDALYYSGHGPAPASLLTAYGDSWTANDTYNTPGLRAVEQLSDRYDTTLVNNAEGGYRAEDIAAWAIGTGGTFVAGSGGTVLVASAGFNDYVQTDTAQQRVATADGIRALFAALVAAERIEETAFTLGAGWLGAQTRADGSGGFDAISSTDAATATYDITTPGTYYLLTHSLDAVHLIGGQLTVTQGATTLAVADLNARHVDTDVYEDSGYGPLAVRLDDVETGTLTVTFNTLGRSGGPAGFIDALVRVDPDPPIILAVKPVRVTQVDYDFQTSMRAYVRGLYDDLPGEFGPTVLVVDPEDPELGIAIFDGHVPALTGGLVTLGPGTAIFDGHVPALTGGIITGQPPQTQRSRGAGQVWAGYGVASWEPPIATPPANIPTDAVAIAQIRALAYTAGVMVGTQPTLTAPITATRARAQDRLLIGSKDATYLRGVPTPIPPYSLVSPLLYGSASLTLPQVSAYFERPGHGDLSWLKENKRVWVQRVVAGAVVATDYKGIVVGFDADARGALIVLVGGEATGPAALRDKQPPLFFRRNDLGFWWWAGISELGLPFEPRTGPDTGIVLRNEGGMSHLDYLQDLSAKGSRRDGSQWTCMPGPGGAYRVAVKDTTTIAATIYFDQSLAKPNSMRRDIAEEPNRIYATGVTPEGMRVKFGAYPLLSDSNPPPYPMSDGSPFGIGTTDGDTDSGDGVSVMIWRLVVTGFLDLVDKPGGYDSDVGAAIIGLKEDALSGGDEDDPTLITPTMNQAAWAALFDVGVTSYSISGTQILPAAQRSYTRKWDRSANGSVIGRNRAYDPSRLVVDSTVDMGVGMTRPQMKGFARGQLTPVGDGNYVGAVVLSGGAVIAGEHTPGDMLTEGDLMDARALRPGMNIWAPLFNGGTLFHLSGVDRTPGADGTPETFTLALDTRARDTMKVWEVIARNRESRRNPARAWINQHRSSSLTKDAVGEFDEVGGTIGDRVDLAGGAWTVFPVVAAQEGTISRLRLEVSPNTEFTVAVFGKRIRAGRLHSLVASPLTTSGSKRWSKASVQKKLDKYVLLYAAGDHDDPCGYFPGSKPTTGSGSDSDGDTDPDPLTGKWQDDAGFAYRAFNGSMIWVAVWAADTCHLTPGRIMWPQLEAGS